MTSWTASGIVMKKRVISGSVTVTGPPSAIWRRKIGTTEPEEPSTLPNRTERERRVLGSAASAASTAHSASAFDAPITVAGSTALSVETSTNVLHARRRPPRAPSRAWPSALLRTASTGLRSIIADVLVGGGVEDDRRPVLGRAPRGCRSSSLQSASTATAAAKWRSSTSSRWISKRLSSAWSTQHERARPDAGDLAAQLGADRPAGARDQHAAAGQVAADELDLHAHRARGPGCPPRARRGSGA